MNTLREILREQERTSRMARSAFQLSSLAFLLALTAFFIMIIE